jgi:hypothetical protein
VEDSSQAGVLAAPRRYKPIRDPSRLNSQDRRSTLNVIAATNNSIMLGTPCLINK